MSYDDDDLNRFRAAACRSCEAPIIWGQMPSGKAMPLDAEPDPKGQWVIINGRIRRPDAGDDRLHRPRHTSHFATCVDAPSWRRPR